MTTSTITQNRRGAPIYYYQEPHQTPAWYKSTIKNCYDSNMLRELVRWYIKQRHTPNNDYHGSE